MKHRVSKEVRCPFYHSEENQKMFCEGVQEGTALHLTFSDGKDLVEYKKNHCNRKYHTCRLARMLLEKYEE